MNQIWFADKRRLTRITTYGGIQRGSGHCLKSILLLKPQVSVTQGYRRWAWLAGRWYWRAGRLTGDDGRACRSGRGRHMHPGADAERYRCACLHWSWLGVV